MKENARTSILGAGAVMLIAGLVGWGPVGCLSTSDEETHGRGSLGVGNLRLHGFGVSASGVEPDVSGECFPACRSGYVCVGGECLPVGPGPFCLAVAYCVCPLAPYPGCEEEALAHTEAYCEGFLNSSYPECLP